VVAGVVLLAGCAAPQIDLGCGLDALRSGEQPARWDAVEDEGLIVGPPVEVGPLERDTPRVVELVELFLDLSRPGRSGACADTIRVITVLDEEDMVGRADHVEVR
jgi:hypothetical protein